MNRGFSLRMATKIVDTMIAKWKEAVFAKDRYIEMPIGYLKVVKTPSHLFKKRLRRPKLFGEPTAKRWTIYNQPYRVVWRARLSELEDLHHKLNPIDAEISALLQVVYKEPGAAELSRILELAGSKEVLVLALKAMALNRRVFPGWDQNGFHARVAYQCRQIREGMRMRRTLTKPDSHL